MPNSVTCERCGAALDAPDAAAGVSQACAQCGAAVATPEPVYDAEDISAEETAADVAVIEEGGDHMRDATEDNPFAGLQWLDPADAPIPPPRRPCPACGEMVSGYGVPCPFCGQTFDSTGAKALRGRTPRKTKLDGDDKELLKQFQRGMKTLGGFCVVATVICFWLTIPSHTALPEFSLAEGVATFGFLTGAWMILAIFTFQKHLWAINVVGGVMLLYTIASVLALSILEFVISLMVVRIAFAAAAKGRELKRRGISLNARP